MTRLTMFGNRQGLRSGSATSSSTASPPSVVSSPVRYTPPLPTFSTTSIRTIPAGSKLPGLTSAELKLLREKQTRLAQNASSTLNSLRPGSHIRNALESTLIFAQYEAGTAVCIDTNGWILTCSHCFGDREEKYRAASKRKWLLFYTGLAVQVECREWDPVRDLALLKIIAIESDEGQNGHIPMFHAVPLSVTAPTSKMRILCMGQPGRDDLESTSERKTKYNLVEVSEGTFRGMVKDVDPQDNSEIGTLMHDAWTYWGHSGAPLVREEDGTLIGLHSSWDDRTAMRHGIPQVAIRAFLGQRSLT